MSAPRELDPRDLERLPVFPLPNAVLFPGALLPLHVFEPRYRTLIRDVLAGRRVLGVARLRPGYEAEYYGRPPIFDVCGVGYVEQDAQRPDGRYDVLLRGIGRVRLVEELPPELPYRVFRATPLPDRAPDVSGSETASLAAWKKKLTDLWAQLRPHLPADARDLNALMNGAATAGATADRVAEALVADPDDRQRLLEELDPNERFSRLVLRIDELIDALTPDREISRRTLN